MVIQESPPRLDSVMNPAKRGAGVVIGTYTGLAIADGNPLILLISVPAGIVLGGAAVGVARGLETALEEKIIDLFSRKRRMRR